jgi:transcriptional regulator with XRE-family HTH domain
MTPAELVKRTRSELGLTQRQLAYRAGMTQAAVSRIERDIVSPSYTTLTELMHAMGREPVLSSERIGADWDPVHMRSTRERAPEERLELAIGWNGFALELAAAGERVRDDG